MAYLAPEAYSEHCQISTMELFAKKKKKENSYLAHFSAQPRNNKKNPLPKKFLIFQGMELSDSKIKKFLTFPEMEPCTFQPKLEKLKKIHPGKMELSGFNIKKFLIVSQDKAFLIFRETETRKNF